MPVDGLHAPDVRCAELRQRNAGIAVDTARHAGRPQQLLAQVLVDELVDVAQVLQQLPGLAERRGHQLDQRLGEIGGDVFVGERRAERLRVARCAMIQPVGSTRSDSFSTPLRPPRSTAALAGIDQPGERARNSVDHLRSFPSAHGSSATTSICTRKPGSTRRCTCTQEVVGSRSLSVVLESQVGGLQQRVHVGGVNGFFDDLVEVGAMGLQRAPYVVVGRAHLPGHVARGNQAAVLVRGDRAGNIQGFIDQHGLASSRSPSRRGSGGRPA